MKVLTRLGCFVGALVGHFYTYWGLGYIRAVEGRCLHDFMWG